MSCEREDELLDAIGRGYVDAEVESHIAECRECGELRHVAVALLDDRAATMLEAPVPSAGAMWLRVQLRRRREADAVARRTLVVGQVATLTIALLLIVAFFGGAMATLMHGLVSGLRTSTPMLIVASAWLIAAPLAGWAAIRQK